MFPLPLWDRCKSPPFANVRGTSQSQLANNAESNHEPAGRLANYATVPLWEREGARSRSEWEG
jgi:hypothetical protein